MPKQPLEILQQYWHYNAFRPQQEAIIDAVLNGKDTLALLPTGGGKSVCFQVPALITEGLCLVISPLIALMKDQVENLEKRGIPALSLHSGMSFYEVRKALDQAAQGDIKLLYLSPERLESALFKAYIDHLHINLITVDEAHCVSQWGYDFRPPYLRISSLRTALPGVPVLALTASATPPVQNDIIDKLKFRNAAIFRQSFERAALSYSVFKADTKITKVLDILKGVPGSSIIYCRNRRLTKEVAHLLALQNISADFYHAGLSQEERSNKQEAWINNKTRVIVCTNAFGMGIDKPDVKTVIHFDIPDCLENYYQEAGRAGRDGKRAYAVLLYQAEDAATLEALPDIRFPDMASISKVYQALADYLQIPVGTAEGAYFDFDLNEFVKNFKLDAALVMNILKVLQQEGHLTFNENIFLPSQVIFTTPKELILDVEKSHPALEPIIKCLLRTYEGIYDNLVSVYEKQIAKLLRRNVQDIKDDLVQLYTLGVIEYLPLKETPQLYFMHNRAPAQFLYINQQQYAGRKKQFEERTAVMLRYLNLQQECRARFIAGYFGDTAIKDCGICDVCISRKENELTPEKFNHIQETIYNRLKGTGMPVKELLQQLRGIKKEHAWKVLQFLEAEQKIIIDEFGIVKLN